MRNQISSNLLRSKLWIMFLIGFVGLSACSSETEEPAVNTESSEMVPVQKESDDGEGKEDQIATSTEGTEDAGGTAYYSSTGSVDNEQKADDTDTVNENNSNLDQTRARGVQ